MTELVLQQRATIKANGVHTNGNAKAVTILEEGKTFASVTDAAQYLGVSTANMSYYLHGKRGRTIKGKHVFFTSQRDSNYDAMTAHINAQYEKQAELERKAALWDAHKKAKEEYEEAVAKAMKKVARCKSIYERTMQKAEERNIRLTEAQKEPEELQGSSVAC